MVKELDSTWLYIRGLASGRNHYVVFLGKIPYYCGASFYQVDSINGCGQVLGKPGVILEGWRGGDFMW